MSKSKKHRGGLAPNKYLTQEQWDQLKQYLQRQYKAAPTRLARKRAETNRMIIDLLANTGLRAGELCNLRLRDLPCHHGKPVINIRDGKGQVERSVEISTAFADRLQQFIKRHRPAAKPRNPLFLNENRRPLSYKSLYSKLKIIGKAADLGNLHPHMLRHTFATLFYTDNKNLLLLQDQLGHSKPEITAIYARTANPERRRCVEAFDL